MTVLCLVFLLEMSAFDPWKTGIFRWLCLGVMMLYYLDSVQKTDGNTHVPSCFALLLIPMSVQCLQDPVSAPTALVRNVSFLIFIFVLANLLERESRAETEACMFRFAKLFIWTVLTGSLIFFQRYSGNHDWIGMTANRNMTVSVLMSAAGLSRAFTSRKYRIAEASAVLLAWRTGSRMAAVMTALLYGRRILNHLCISVPLLAGFFMEKEKIVPLRRLFASSQSLKRDTWKIGLDLFAENPLLGCGSGSAWYYTFAENAGGWGRGMHNSWLVILSETGILGALFYLAFFTVSAGHIRSGMYCTDPRLFQACAAVLVMLGVNGLSESFLFSAGNVMSLPFWMSFLFLEKMGRAQA